MSTHTATEEHPEKIEPTLPVHAMAPATEPGDPVRKTIIAEAAYYREAEKEIDALIRAAT